MLVAPFKVKNSRHLSQNVTLMYFVTRLVYLKRLKCVPSPRLTFELAVSCLANLFSLVMENRNNIQITKQS